LPYRRIAVSYLDAKNLGINISQACEQRLREEIQSRKERQWNEQHADFIAAYNSLVEEEDGTAGMARLLMGRFDIYNK
jgi:post-segregation antitoxin (ccd killing protein)